MCVVDFGVAVGLPLTLGVAVGLAVGVRLIGIALGNFAILPDTLGVAV
jgi:hypothetical protein